jgi:hypothetical protein
MSSDLIAWVVAITLAIAVIGLGLRRNLSDVTQSWLPRFGEDSEPAVATPELFDGGQGRRQSSPRQMRLAIWFSLLASATNAAFAVLSAENRLPHVISAVLFAIAAAIDARRLSSSLKGSTS